MTRMSVAEAVADQVDDAVPEVKEISSLLRRRLTHLAKEEKAAQRALQAARQELARIEGERESLRVAIDSLDPPRQQSGRASGKRARKGRSSAKRTSANGPTSGQQDVLDALEAAPGRTSSLTDLAKSLGLTPSSTQTRLRGLIERGMVAKVSRGQYRRVDRADDNPLDTSLLDLIASEEDGLSIAALEQRLGSSDADLKAAVHRLVLGGKLARDSDGLIHMRAR